jgi:hypothetical protein
LTVSIRVYWVYTFDETGIENGNFAIKKEIEDMENLPYIPPGIGRKLQVKEATRQKKKTLSCVSAGVSTKIKQRPTITPIDTIYNGYRFRSRLEARWAVFFDALNIRYEYEKEGYRLSNGEWYLPDFWLPDYQWIVEIKPEYPSEREIDKIRIVSEGLGWTGLILYGQIPNYSNVNRIIVGIGNRQLWGEMAHLITSEPGFIYSPDYGHHSSYDYKDEDTGKYWDDENGNLVFAYNGKGSEIFIASTLGFDDCDCIPFFAFDAARQARFEHGEKPL